MVDYGEVVGEGMSNGLGMLWAAVTANPWVALLFLGIAIGGVWLQLSSRRRGR